MITTMASIPRILIALPAGPLFSWITCGILRRQQLHHDVRLITMTEGRNTSAILDHESIQGVIGVWSPSGTLGAARAKGIPVINISDRLPDPEAPSVVCDNLALGRLAAEHLADCGYESLLMLTRNPDIHYNSLRFAGFSAVANERGLGVDLRRISRDCSPLLSDLVGGCGLWLDSDLQALNVIESCREADLPVPGQIGVLGTDDAPLVCDICVPRISSVASAGVQVGETALDLLASHLRHGRVLPQRTLIPPEGVIVRDSTDLMAVDDPGLRQAVAAIREHACRSHRFGVEAVAAAAHCSRRSLEQRFRRHFNGTVYGEIRRLRVREALRLLRDPSLKLSVIAQCSGFAGADQCAAAVRAITGKSPQAWRQTMSRA